MPTFFDLGITICIVSELTQDSLVEAGREVGVLRVPGQVAVPHVRHAVGGPRQRRRRVDGRVGHRPGRGLGSDDLSQTLDQLMQ